MKKDAVTGGSCPESGESQHETAMQYCDWLAEVRGVQIVSENVFAVSSFEQGNSNSYNTGCFPTG